MSRHNRKRHRTPDEVAASESVDTVLASRFVCVESDNEKVPAKFTVVDMHEARIIAYFYHVEDAALYTVARNRLAESSAAQA